LESLTISALVVEVGKDLLAAATAALGKEEEQVMVALVPVVPVVEGVAAAMAEMVDHGVLLCTWCWSQICPCGWAWNHKCVSFSSTWPVAILALLSHQICCPEVVLCQLSSASGITGCNGIGKLKQMLQYAD
jgi:hypothetical protein